MTVLDFPSFLKYGDIPDSDLGNKLLEENIKLQEKIECLEKEILDFKRIIREKNLLKHFKK